MAMKLYAISDLHLGSDVNRQGLLQLPPHPEDWLILAGDVGETEAHLEFALSFLTQRFARILWTPGNHDLWTLPAETQGLRGEAKYRRLVEICQGFDVLTPEDPYVTWPGAPEGCLLAPIFTLYDYTFRPDHLSQQEALAWAEEEGVVCTDEWLLHPDPFPTRAAWCAMRCRYTEDRLQQLPPDQPLILIGHFPLRQDLAILPRIPPFSLWCGTRRTETWHTRFPVKAVIYGHLHIRGTYLRDGVRFEEVSLGYPRHWRSERGVEGYLREIRTDG